MTHDEAGQLAARITATWRGGPTATIWTEELERLDAGTAGTAYARLRREEEHAPSLAKYLAVYRALHTPSRDAEQAICPMCSKSGWIESEPLRHIDTAGNERFDSQVIPCPAGCEYGAQARRILPVILEANARPS